MKYLYINKYWNLNKEYYLDKLLYLMIDRPNEISCGGSYSWLNNKDQHHRNYDLPSGFYQFIDKMCINLFWHKNNNHYRKNNKAIIIYYDGHKSYFK